MRCARKARGARSQLGPPGTNLGPLRRVRPARDELVQVDPVRTPRSPGDRILRLSHAGHQKLTIFGRAPGHGGPCERNARLMGYAGGPSVRRRCAEATAPQIAKSIGRRIYLAGATLGARSRRRRPFGAAGGGGAAFLSLPRAVWSPSILSPTANGLLVAPGTHAHGACKTRSHQISVMTERRRRRPIREMPTCAGPQGPTMPSFRPIEPPQRPRRPPILKKKKAWGAPRRRGRFRGGLLLLLFYSILLLQVR